MIALFESLMQADSLGRFEIRVLLPVAWRVPSTGRLFLPASSTGYLGLDRALWLALPAHGGLPLPQEDLEPRRWLLPAFQVCEATQTRSSACRPPGRARPKRLRVCGLSTKVASKNCDYHF